MKKFDIITESDARVLAHGETVMLARRGHITPLAQDTLKERRIVVIGEDAASPEDAALAPRADIRTLVIASDHTGIALRKALLAWLRGRGEADAGIVIDGAGIGSAIAANKIRGVRAVMATSETIARYSREHNGANVLTLGASLMTHDEARAIVTAWLGASMREPRYIRRLAKIRDLEREEQ